MIIKPIGLVHHYDDPYQAMTSLVASCSYVNVPLTKYCEDYRQMRKGKRKFRRKKDTCMPIIFRKVQFLLISGVFLTMKPKKYKLFTCVSTVRMNYLVNFNMKFFCLSQVLIVRYMGTILPSSRCHQNRGAHGRIRSLQTFIFWQNLSFWSRLLSITIMLGKSHPFTRCFDLLNRDFRAFHILP